MALSQRDRRFALELVEHPTIDPVEACLRHASRAVEATSQEDADAHLGMASFWAHVSEITALHRRGDHSRCAHHLLGLD